MGTDEYGDKKEKKPERRNESDYLALRFPYSQKTVDEYVGACIAKHGFAVVLSPEAFHSHETQKEAAISFFLSPCATRYSWTDPTKYGTCGTARGRISSVR